MDLGQPGRGPWFSHPEAFMPLPTAAQGWELPVNLSRNGSTLLLPKNRLFRTRLNYDSGSEQEIKSTSWGSLGVAPNSSVYHMQYRFGNINYNSFSVCNSHSFAGENLLTYSGDRFEDCHVRNLGIRMQVVPAYSPEILYRDFEKEPTPDLATEGPTRPAYYEIVRLFIESKDHTELQGVPLVPCDKLDRPCSANKTLWPASPLDRQRPNPWLSGPQINQEHGSWTIDLPDQFARLCPFRGPAVYYSSVGNYKYIYDAERKKELPGVTVENPLQLGHLVNDRHTHAGDNLMQFYGASVLGGSDGFLGFNANGSMYSWQTTLEGQSYQSYAWYICNFTIDNISFRLLRDRDFKAPDLNGPPKSSCISIGVRKETIATLKNPSPEAVAALESLGAMGRLEPPPQEILDEFESVNSPSGNSSVKPKAIPPMKSNNTAPVKPKDPIFSSEAMQLIGKIFGSALLGGLFSDVPGYHRGGLPASRASSGVLASRNSDGLQPLNIDNSKSKRKSGAELEAFGQSRAPYYESVALFVESEDHLEIDGHRLIPCKKARRPHWVDADTWPPGPGDRYEENGRPLTEAVYGQGNETRTLNIPLDHATICSFHVSRAQGGWLTFDDYTFTYSAERTKELPGVDVENSLQIGRIIDANTTMEQDHLGVHATYLSGHDNFIGFNSNGSVYSWQNDSDGRPYSSYTWYLCNVTFEQRPSKLLRDRDLAILGTNGTRNSPCTKIGVRKMTEKTSENFSPEKLAGLAWLDTGIPPRWPSQGMIDDILNAVKSTGNSSNSSSVLSKLTGEQLAAMSMFTKGLLNGLFKGSQNWPPSKRRTRSTSGLENFSPTLAARRADSVPPPSTNTTVAGTPIETYSSIPSGANTIVPADYPPFKVLANIYIDAPGDSDWDKAVIVKCVDPAGSGYRILCVDRGVAPYPWVLSDAFALPGTDHSNATNGVWYNTTEAFMPLPAAAQPAKSPAYSGMHDKNLFLPKNRLFSIKMWDANDRGRRVGLTPYRSTFGVASDSSLFYSDFYSEPKFGDESISYRSFRICQMSALNRKVRLTTPDDSLTSNFMSKYCPSGNVGLRIKVLKILKETKWDKEDTSTPPSTLSYTEMLGNLFDPFFGNLIGA